MEECQEMLQSLASHSFTPRAVLPIPLLSNIQSFAMASLTGSLYPAEGIECALKRAFGTQRTLVGDSWASRHGVKVLLPATAVPGNVPYLFSNGRRTVPASDTPDHPAASWALRNKSGYRAISELDGSDEIRVWEV